MERLEALAAQLPEAAAVIATDVRASPAGYGLGRHGWVAYDLESDATDEWWREIAEWVETSYTLVAPKTLARQVIDGAGPDD